MSSAFQELTPEHQLKKPWWRVADAHFKAHTLVEHQIDSYNTHIQKIPGLIQGSPLEYTKDENKYIIEFQNVRIQKPTHIEVNGIKHNLYPNECRIRNLSYMCNIYADIERILLEDDTPKSNVTYENICLGAIPCMVGSDLCNLKGLGKEDLIKLEECFKDPGGYFIINGTEKALQPQDRSAHGDIFVFKGKDPIKTEQKGEDKRSIIPCAWSAEVRSYSDNFEPNITTTYIKLSEPQLSKGEDQRLYVTLPNIEAPIAWPIIFMALGVTDPDEMIDYVCGSNDQEMINLLSPSLSCPGIKTQKDALEYICNFVKNQKDLDYVKKIFRQKLFQNITEFRMKRNFLGHMTHELLSTALGRRSENDRDHAGYKRVVHSGRLITDLFKGVWRRITKEVSNNLTKKRSDDLQQQFQGKITNYITPPFATGNWTATKTAKATKAGISQIVNRMNYVAGISGLRRVVTPSDKNSKIVKPRHLHNSQWPYYCPAETPEGHTCGLIRNLALLTAFSMGFSDIIISTWLVTFSDCVTMLCDMEKRQDTTRVFINGVWVAYSNDPETLIKRLKGLKHDGKIPYETSISLGREGVRIYTDEGRLLTPVFIVKDGKLKDIPEEDFTWQDLLDKAIIEYLDPLEMETLKIATKPWDLKPDDTHSLIHPSFMLGISASTAPFPDHNQSPRNAYQAAMGKQGLGIACKNQKIRCDTSAHTLCYPQTPLVKTKGMMLTGADDMPSGQNLIVAIITGAYNMEDSVIINKRAIDNGALRSEAETTYSESRFRKGHTTEDIKKPDKNGVQETRMTGYSKLDRDGLCKEGTPIQKRDVVIGKVNTTPTTSKDTSVIVKTNGMRDNAVMKGLNADGEEFYDVNEGYASITQSYLTTNSNMHRTAVIKVNQYRVPEVGDKVASRSAQKGICGKIVNAEDAAYSEETGIPFDLVLNPHALPSRMTIGHMLETLMGKACAMNGATVDATPFEPETNYELAVKELEKYGFDGYGDEILINGKTGERMNCKIFVGPTYYQRLKHMVADKIHARDQDGPRETLTRQPVEGRKRGGGFRMGEMESWCGVSHGASNFLFDRLVTNSDGYEMYVCDHCGNTAIANTTAKRFECKLCQQNTAISKVKIPYSAKLLKQNLAACGIGMWMNVDKDT